MNIDFNTIKYKDSIESFLNGKYKEYTFNSLCKLFRAKPDEVGLKIEKGEKLDNILLKRSKRSYKKIIQKHPNDYKKVLKELSLLGVVFDTVDNIENTEVIEDTKTVEELLSEKLETFFNGRFKNKSFDQLGIIFHICPYTIKSRLNLGDSLEDILLHRSHNSLIIIKRRNPEGYKHILKELEKLGVSFSYDNTSMPIDNVELNEPVKDAFKSREDDIKSFIQDKKNECFTKMLTAVKEYNDALILKMKELKDEVQKLGELILMLNNSKLSESQFKDK